MYELMRALAMLTATVAVAEAAGNYDCGASTCKLACHANSKQQLICTCRRQDLKNGRLQGR